MEKKSYLDLTLVLIASNSGNLTWYQIERALNVRSIAGQINSVKLANQLRDQGLIEVEKTAGGLFYYFITEEGKKRVKILIEHYGADRYGTYEQNPDDYEV